MKNGSFLEVQGTPVKKVPQHEGERVAFLQGVVEFPIGIYGKDPLDSRRYAIQELARLRGSLIEELE